MGLSLADAYVRSAELLWWATNGETRVQAEQLQNLVSPTVSDKHRLDHHNDSTRDILPDFECSQSSVSLLWEKILLTKSPSGIWKEAGSGEGAALSLTEWLGLGSLTQFMQRLRRISLLEQSSPKSGLAGIGIDICCCRFGLSDVGPRRAAYHLTAWGLKSPLR